MEIHWKYERDFVSLEMQDVICRVLFFAIRLRVVQALAWVVIFLKKSTIGRRIRSQELGFDEFL